MLMRCTVVLAVVALGAVAACGGEEGADGGSATAPRTTATGSGASPTPSTPSPSGPQQLPRELRLPAGVPTRSAGVPTDAVSARVIRKWSGALRGGDLKRAARFFALPSKVQNGTPVLTLDTAGKRLVFNAAFPCGAKPTKLEQASGGFTIADFVLTERVGGDCGSGTGGSARTAIRVRDGHIVDWYRVPDRRTSPQPNPEPPEFGAPGTRIV